MSRILCVDDNKDANDLTGIVLQKLGRVVTTVSTIAEAALLLNINNYHLYVLDWQLDELDGVDLCRTIRRTNKEVPIIIYSGHAHASDLANGKEAGATLYLTKPDGIDAIVGIVDEFLSEKEIT